MLIGVELEIGDDGAEAPDSAEVGHAVDVLGEAFPTLIIDRAPPPGAPEDGERRLFLRVRDFVRGSPDRRELDALVRSTAAEGPFMLTLATGRDDLALSEGIVTRYQRFIARRNVHSRAPLFEVLLAKHRRLFTSGDQLRSPTTSTRATPGTGCSA